LDSPEILFYAMMLFGCLSLYQSASIFTHRISAPALMEAIHKLIRNKNIDRAIKLCSVVPRSPLATSVKFVLLYQSSLQQKTPEEVKRFCEDAFQAEARIFSARTALPLLDAVIYSGAAAIFYFFKRGLADWQSVLLFLPSLAALLMYQLRAGVLRDLDQHQYTLAKMLSVDLPAGGPYR
jgi:hypothetical protein